MKLSEKVSSMDGDEFPDLEPVAEEIAALEAELADTKAQLEYVRNTVRTGAEVMSTLEAENAELKARVEAYECLQEQSQLAFGDLIAERDALKAKLAAVR